MARIDMKTGEEILTAEFWSSAEAVVMDPGLPKAEIDALRAWAAREKNCDGCVLFSTSGSSGQRKWIVLSREALLFSAKSVVARFGIAQNDVLGLVLPFYHVGGFGLLARAWVSGAKSESFRQKWSAPEFTEWAREKGVTITSLVPTQVSDLVAKHCRAPESLRVAVVGGGRFEPDLQARAQALGWPVLASYGMTETCSQMATERIGEKGMWLFPDWEARVAASGRLSLRGKALLSGMVERQGAFFSFFDPKIEGWFETSDLVRLQEGKIEVVGRADRQVKVLGELVSLEKIERIFREKLGGEVRVRAEKDERAGRRLFLQTENCSEKKLAEAVAEYHRDCQGFERLSAWKTVEKLKRSALGKLLD